LMDNKVVYKIKDLRWIFVVRELIPHYCEFKSKISRNANIIQALDAELARYLIKRCSVWTVHDSFATSLFDLHELHDHTCIYFKNKLNVECNNPFILI
jgi:hypothetical protein